MYRPAWQHVVGLVVSLLIVVAIGWLAGRPVLYASLFLGAVVAWQAWNLIRYERWLRLRASMKPPNMNGLWGEAVAISHRMQRRKVFHKRRVLVLLREFRRMTDGFDAGVGVLDRNK